MRCLLFVVALLLLVPIGLADDAREPVGIVSHIKVLSNHCEDVSSPEDWRRTYIKEGMTDHDKALAIWKTVVRYRHQTNPPNEYLIPDKNVHDPLKTIHVYGYGMCCCATSNVCGLARYVGMKARGLSITRHTISEIFYDNTWHMIDGSLMNYFCRPDGAIASADEVMQAVTRWHEENPGYRGNNAKLVQFAANENWKKSGPALLAKCETFGTNGFNAAGVHGWHATMQEYDYTTAGEYECLPSMGYQLNVQLREGERLTRNWFNKGKVIDWTDADILAGGERILGLQRQLGDKAPGRIGNGVLQYDVPLASGVFRGGALAADNLACTSDDRAAPAMHVKDPAQKGVYIVRMPSSYVYLSGTVTLKAVVGGGGSIVVSYSENHGLDWKEMAKITASGDRTIDLSPHVVRKYDCRLKFELSGKGTGLDALSIVHDVQHSQAPLPTLLEGRNTITFSAGPPEGTITVEPNTAPGSTSWRQLEIQNFHAVVNNAKMQWARPQGRGDMKLRIPAPGEIVRLHMNLGYRLRDARDSYTISASFDEGKTWKEIGRLNGPTPGCTEYLTLADVPAGARAVVVKFEGKEVNTACLFGLRIDVDYKEPYGGFRPVKITYVWHEDGQQKTHVHVATRPRETYTINCGPKTVVRSFTVELAD